MTWRFRKSVKLFPGVRVNLSRGGISTTVGVRGLSVNVGPRGTYLNQGIPCTGLYSRTKLTDRRRRHRVSLKLSRPSRSQRHCRTWKKSATSRAPRPKNSPATAWSASRTPCQEAFAEFAELRREVSAAWQELNNKQERN